MNKLLNYRGLYGDNQEPFFSHIPHHEIIETRSRLYDWAIEQHVHTELCQIFVFTSGNGTLISEHHTLSLETPCLVFVPNNRLHGFTFQPNIKGDVFTFSERLFKEILEKTPHISLKIRQLQQYSLGEKKEIFDTILRFKNQLIHELKNTLPEKTTIIQLYLQLIFIQIYRLDYKEDTTISTTDNKTLFVFQTFRKLIFDYMSQYKTVKEYAQVIGIPLVELNKICKTVAQKTPLELIHQYKIEEAKNLLRMNEYSVSEVSYKIGITDTSYFSRLFKQQTGMTPKFYRQG